MTDYSKKLPKLKPGPRTLAKQRELALQEPPFDYSVVLLLDTSGSMSGEKLRDAKEALISFLRDIDLTKNMVGLVAFGEGIWAETLIQGNSYVERIRGMNAGDGTPMMAGIIAAHKTLETHKMLTKDKVTPVMVIATDGRPTDAPEERILKYADPIEKDGTRIITIGIGKDVNDEFLRKLASSSEDYHFAKASFELKRIYKKVAAGLAKRR